MCQTCLGVLAVSALFLISWLHVVSFLCCFFQRFMVGHCTFFFWLTLDPNCFVPEVGKLKMRSLCSFLYETTLRIRSRILYLLCLLSRHFWLCWHHILILEWRKLRVRIFSCCSLRSWELRRLSPETPGPVQTHVAPEGRWSFGTHSLTRQSPTPSGFLLPPHSWLWSQIQFYLNFGSGQGRRLIFVDEILRERSNARVNGWMIVWPPSWTSGKKEGHTSNKLLQK